jgi:acetyl-CoA carboxylase carboxyl transferase subunit alpha
MARLKVPIISVVIGEGGSGGALALGMGDRILMLEHAVYSVISPEGCAAILWGDSARSAEAAEAMKLSAAELLRQKVIDQVIEEPLGGAHRNPAKMAKDLKEAVQKSIQMLSDVPPDKLVLQRYEKFRRMGIWGES